MGPAGWTPPRRGGSSLVGGTLDRHIIGVPLLILASIGVGFVTVVLREVLLPFVISIFLVYLIRPLVNMLTTPFAACFPCLAGPPAGYGGPAAGTGLNAPSGRGKGGPSRYARLDRSGGDSATSEDVDAEGPPLTPGREGPKGRRSSSPGKYPRTVRGMVTRVVASASDWAGGRGGPPPPGRGQGAGQPHGVVNSEEEGVAECGCCCGPLRFTRCPRWFAIVVAMAVASALLAGLVLMVADAIQRFQQDSLGVFILEAGVLVDHAQRWLAGLGISLEGHAILDAIKQQITVTLLVQTTVAVLVDGVGNALLVLLLVLYLLSESNTHLRGSLRARIDDQIGRYIGIKTLISAFQGALVYAIMGPYGCKVRMAHVFGVIHFILNFIPTAGPIIATIVPLPVVILDPALSVSSKIAAFVGPTVVHFLVGNFLEPLVFGSSMELHPVIVLLSLALWFALWGVPGAILAVPITAVLRIVLGAVSHHPYAAVVISILEGRLSAAMEGVDTALDASGLGVGGLGRRDSGESVLNGLDLEEGHGHPSWAHPVHGSSTGAGSKVSLVGRGQGEVELTVTSKSVAFEEVQGTPVPGGATPRGDSSPMLAAMVCAKASCGRPSGGGS